MNGSSTRSASGGVTTPVIPEHEMLHAIASGSYGEVWLARSALGAYRAVKIVRRSSFDHDRPFEREFSGIKAFEPISRSHDHLVDVLQVGRNDRDGYLYYVMELADDLGGKDGERQPEAPNRARVRAPNTAPTASHSYTPRTLKAELERQRRMPLDECIELGLAMCGALAYLHQRGLVHRDIKPSNILFVGGVPKLADVGLVANLGEARSYVGTEGFIPPEGPGKPPADLYSLGIVLYQMSTGKSHQDFPEPLADLAAQPDHARWLELNSIIHKACRADVRDRFQSAEEMRDELALLQRGQSVRRKRVAQRRWTFAGRLGLGVVAAGFLSGAVLFLQSGKPGHTPDPQAARLYEQGRWYYSQLTPEDHQKALESLTQAVRTDPKFVQPYGELTALYTWLMLPGITNEQIRLQKVKELADKALAINPHAAEGHIALSWCKFLERDWRGAEAEIARAIKLNPNLPIAHGIYSFYLSMQGRTAEARREGQRAEELEPPGSERVTAIIASWPFIAERRFDLAAVQLKRVLDLDGNFSSGHSYLADLYEAQSNYVGAIAEYRTCAQLLRQDPDRVLASYAALRQAYDTQGEQGYLRKMIDLVRADRSLPEDRQIFADMDLVGYYARLGEKEKALDELEQHFDEPQVWHQIKFKPMYDRLHGEPRFQALLKRAGLAQ